MKIYTRTGDQGETSLFGGQRVAKDHDRIEAYGTIDELNAVLGVAQAELAAEGDPGELAPLLDRLQHQLFDLGAELAAPSPEKQGTDLLGDPQVEELESEIDRLEEKLPPLTQFILPGGTLAASHLHVARCVCRRAERLIVALGHHEAVRDTPIRYVNRLADLLFVVARVANQAAGRPDVPWQKTTAAS
ncbi:MAG: cob(I)yrinic acid a,c-diamide adenosyltransferase [Planctomycetota bacterium]